MSKQKALPGNAIIYYVYRPFNEYRICHSFSPIEALVELGCSKSYAKNLIKSGSVKIIDYKVADKNKILTYKRPVKACEMLELIPDLGCDLMYVGKKVVEIKPYNSVCFMWEYPYD